MPSTHSLLEVLRSDYPQFEFLLATQAHWSPDSRTIFYSTETSPAELLHELAHALLDHKKYRRDVELIKIERDAWDHAAYRLAPMYAITIDEEIVETALDSYRDWLHTRSACPSCNATGIQSSHHTYRCLACQTIWSVNEAKTCALRRYKIDPH
jgi:hypothetical protein